MCKKIMVKTAKKFMFQSRISSLMFQVLVNNSFYSDSYKPDGPYGVFAGHDISISLGKMNITEEFLD